METSAPSVVTKASRKIGGFELGEKIGQGGMGAVFKARQISLDRIVALKLLPPKIAQKNPVFIERFLREARSLAKLNHPNIVQGIDVGFDELQNVYFFAMEYVDGPTVKVVLEQQKVLSERKALEIVKGVAQALICAHRVGIIHRDIKPDNILLTSRGEPKLADLGLAHFVLDAADNQDAEDKKNNDNAELTQAGFTVGTPNYMSPEQIKGRSDIVDARSDLYALGATLFHLVTGRAPYVAETISLILQMHQQAPVPNARSVNPMVSEDTNRLIAQLMRKEQVERIQTAELLDEQIARILAMPDRGRTVTGTHAPITTGKHTPINRELKRSDQQPIEKPPKSRAARIYIVSAGVICVGLMALMLVVSLSSGLQENTNIVQQPMIDPIEQLNPQPNPQPNLTNVKPPSVNPDLTPPTPPTLPLLPKKNLLPKWAPLEKAREAARQQPEDYQNLIRAFMEAEQDAPPKLINEIRRQRDKVEREQRQAFRKVLAEFNAKAQDRLKQKDYAGAINAIQEELCPPNLLSEYNRSKLSRARKDIEAGVLDDYLKLQESNLYAELKAAGQNLPQLEAFDVKLTSIERQYVGVQTVLDKLKTLRHQLVIHIQDANANLIHQQDMAFKQWVNAACQIAARGDLQKAEDELNKSLRDKSLERFSVKLRQLIMDVQTVRAYLQKAEDALIEKMRTNTELTLHPSGTTITGRLIDKNAEGFSLEDKDARVYIISLVKLDPWELVTLSGIASDDIESRYAAGICYFWQGKQEKAYETLLRFKKEESKEANQAAFYLGWVEEIKSNQPQTDPKILSEKKSPQPADQPKHKVSRKTETKPGREITNKYLQYAQTLLPKQEAARDWPKAWDSAYRLEQYDQALNYLGHMLSEPKRWEQKMKESWFNQKLWETAILARNQPPQELLEKFFNNWKEQMLADIKALPKPWTDENWVKAESQRRQSDLAKREAYFRTFPTLRAELVQLENDGEDNPKALWELCIRFGEKRPYAPLHYARVLYKLREWYPDFKHVTNGDVQYRLMDCLSDDLSPSSIPLSKDAGDEAIILIDKYSAYPRVTNGDALWILANNRSRQDYQNKNNKEMAAILMEAKNLYKKFSKNYEKHWANRPNQHTQKSICQDHLRDLERKIRKYD
ncbi:MAG: protein kinase [Planctomycetota bacterium]